MFMPRLAISLGLLFLPSLVTLAFLGPPRAGTGEPPVAFRGATLHPVAGPKIEHGVVVIHRGKIIAVGGADTPIPPEARVIDATGKTIIPGLVDTHSHIGIYARPGVPAHSDGNEGSGAVQTGLRAEDAIFPDDPGIRMAVAGGVTTANIMPGSGNVIGGQTLYVKLRGQTIEEMRIKGMKVLGGLKMANGENPKTFNFGRNKTPPNTRMKLAALQREQFVKARDYQRKLLAHRKLKSAGKETTPPDSDPAMETLVEVLERKRTVHFHSHRADDLMTALRLAKEFDFELVLQHATEGYRIARELAERKVPASLTLVDSPGGKLEALGLIEENAAILTKAGIKVAINTDDPVTESRFYLRTGAIALRGGLTEDEALKALTLNPAEMLHLEDRLGSLERGKDADLVVLSGPPFSLYTQVLETYIDGVRVFDRSRNREWAYQTGGFALDNRHPLPPAPALVKPLASVKAPALPGGAVKPNGSVKRLAILAGRIHTVGNSDILDGVILIEDGRIAAVGPRAEVRIPRGTPMLTAAVVTPGLIDAHSSVGLSGAANVKGDQDQDEKTDPNQADLRVMDGFNPDEGLLEFIRREGVTTIHAVLGRTNVIAGQTGVFRTAGRTAESMVLRFPAGILVNLGESPKGVYPGKLPTTRMGTAALLRTALTQARNYARKQAATRGTDKQPPVDPRLDALGLALAGKVPVLFAAHRADDLATALRLAREFDLQAQLHLATEGYRIADVLAKSGVSVVVHPTMQRAGSSMETLHSHLMNAAELAKKKVPLAIGTGFEGYVPKTRVLRHEAAIAAINGLGHDKALRAITLDAAKILGIDKSRGSIGKGKVADLVLYDGDCFEHATHVTHTILEGRIVYDRAEYQAIPFARRALPLTSGGGLGCCLGVW
jgi:imidazolonepropionase-like amidohydrolase